MKTKKKSFIGWTFPNWVENFYFNKIHRLKVLEMDSIYKYQHKKYRWEDNEKPVKIRITIEEIECPKKES